MITGGCTAGAVLPAVYPEIWFGLGRIYDGMWQPLLRSTFRRTPANQMLARLGSNTFPEPLVVCEQWLNEMKSKVRVSPTRTKYGH